MFQSKHKTTQRTRQYVSSNATTVTEVRSASFGLVLHVHHIFAIPVISSSPEGYQLQFSIPRAHFVYTVWK